MSTDVRDQIRAHYQSIDEAQRDIVFDEILALVDDAPVILAGSSRNRDRLRRRRWLAVGAALVVIFLLILPSLLMDRDSPDVVDPTPTTSPPTQSTIFGPDVGQIDVPLVRAIGAPVASVDAEKRPFGDLAIEHSAGESTFTPIGSHWEGDWNTQYRPGRTGVVVGDDEYIALAAQIKGDDRLLIRSADGLTWESLGPIEIDRPEDALALYELGGVFWIEAGTLEGRVSLYRSADLVSWEQVELRSDFGWMRPPPIEFDARVLAFGEVALSLDPETGEVVRLDVPWADGTAMTVYVDRDGLQVVVGEGSGSPASAGGLVQYSTRDLTDWVGPHQPSVLTDALEITDSLTGDLLDVIWVSVSGSTSSGLLASLTHEGRDEFGNSPTVDYVSLDGRTWAAVADPNGRSEFPYADWVTGSIVDGEPLLVAANEELGRPASILISANGVEWQEIPIEVTPSPGIDTAENAGVHTSMAVLGDRILYFDNSLGWLNSWAVTIPSG